jgi:hypothetical protein
MIGKFDEAIRRLEAELITSALIETGGNLAQAARLLGIRRQRLQYMLRVPHRNLFTEKWGAELMKFAATVLPVNLPAEVREEAQAAIVLDLLNKSVKPEHLKDARLVRKYVSAAYGLQNPFKFKSLDAPVGDGETTLGELIAA